MPLVTMLNYVAAAQPMNFCVMKVLNSISQTKTTPLPPRLIVHTQLIVNSRSLDVHIAANVAEKIVNVPFHDTGKKGRKRNKSTEYAQISHTWTP